MADTLTTLADLRLATALSVGLRRLIDDPTDLRSTCVRVDDAPNGSMVIQVGQMQYVYNLSAPGEGVAPAETPLDVDSFSITNAIRKLRLSVTDEVLLTGDINGPGVEALIEAGRASVVHDFGSLLVAQFPSLTASVGSTGVDMDADTFSDAIETLQSAGVPGPYYAVLSPVSFGQLQKSLEGLAGSMKFNDATDEMLKIKGPGFKGSWRGVDVYTFDDVNTINVGADYSNAMYGLGCFEYRELALDSLAQAIGMAGGQTRAREGVRALVEVVRGRDSNGASTGALEIIVHYAPGVSIAEQDRGAEIVGAVLSSLGPGSLSWGSGFLHPD